MEMGGETRFGQKRNAFPSGRLPLVKLPQVQPVNAGTSRSGDDKVVDVDEGTGPVNESTNV